jgi:putative ABC transport system permease protein
MIKSYLKMAWRNLWKDRVSSIVNICGLSIGLAVGIAVLLVVTDQLEYDRSNRNINDIAILMANERLGDQISTRQVTPGPLAAAVRTSIPDVKYTVRVSQEDRQLLHYGDKNLYEACIYAEPDFFNMMTYPALEGDPLKTLQDPGGIVLTARTAKKFFGDSAAIGKTVTLDGHYALRVGAILKDPPSNNTHKFGMVLPFSLYEQNNPWLTKWDDNRIQTWIQLIPHANRAAVNDKLKALFYARQNSKDVDLFAYPFADIHLRGQFENGHPSGGVVQLLIMLCVTGLIVILIGCINFMNLATARSERRAREVGVRKVMGASRRSLVLQFIAESMLMAFLALVLAVLIVGMVMPFILRTADGNFEPDYFNWRMWAGIAALCVFTGLVAGSVPAFYLSRFQPVLVLKKLMTTGRSHGWLRKGLVTFQFVVATTLIIGIIVITTQLSYLHSIPVGYKQDGLINISVNEDIGNKFSVIKNELLQTPGVESVTASSDNMVNFGGGISGVNWSGKTAGQDLSFAVSMIDYDWAKTTGATIIAGRDFGPDYGDSTSCLVNEAAVKAMGMKTPIGATLSDHRIVGVFKDFRYNDPANKPAPMMLLLSQGGPRNIIVRIRNNEVIPGVEKAVKKIDPDYPFAFDFIKDKFNARFESSDALAFLVKSFGAMAILISCMGLFGLSAFLAERRNKEVGIRKVLGASISGLWFALSKDFLKPVMLAFVIAAPLSGWGMQLLLDKMYYHVSITWWMFALAGTGTLLIALGTVSFHGIKAALANPARILNND